ncbi:NAD(P)/FAD-dependent oxidoreductase [Rhodobacteraceae bacterium]|nr:NAD(P)/FAD-dependent oxidoreductase [Paracoccaceae bacterium]
MSTVLIVGAGPAGIRAAQMLVQAGLHPVVVDEAARAGGQVYRRPPEGFLRTPAQLYGTEAGKAVRLHRDFDEMVARGQITYLPERSVVALSPKSAADGGGGVAHVLGTDRREVAYDRLILATGATDRLAPVAGWQQAGVYSLGAAQIALKAQGVSLGRRIVLAGTGPLLTLLAYQLVCAGAHVAQVLDTSPLGTQMRGGLRMAAARPWVTARGLRLRARLGRRYKAGVRLEEITGGVGGVEAIRWRDARGHSHMTECDMVGLGWHLRADGHLPDLAGAEFTFSPVYHQWMVQADELGRAGAGLYLAGDGLAILGADGAELAGALAAIACLADLGLSHPSPVGLLRRARRMARFAEGLAQAFPWPAHAVATLSHDTVICRCEGITAGCLRQTATLSGPDANRAKSLSRVGMGRCQGRYCQLAGAEIVAAATAQDVADIGRLRAQPPVRPAPIGAWLRPAGCATDPAARLAPGQRQIPLPDRDI